MNCALRNKTRCLLLAASFLLSFLFVSCDKTPMNGLLDGMWHLTRIETPAGQRDVKDSLIYISIQLQLVQWSDRLHQKHYFSHFTHRGDSLLFFDMTHSSRHSVDNNTDAWITNEEMSKGLFDVWGIHTLNPGFHINTLNHSDLILQRADTLLRLRRF